MKSRGEMALRAYSTSSAACRPQKFWVLETVARIPYFAYISILHLYESLGFWRAGAELRKIHFAEEWNGEVAGGNPHTPRHPGRAR